MLSPKKRAILIDVLFVAAFVLTVGVAVVGAVKTWYADPDPVLVEVRLTRVQVLPSGDTLLVWKSAIGQGYLETTRTGGHPPVGTHKEVYLYLD